MTLLYLSWIREAMGTDSEEIDLPDTVITVADLVEWLAARSPALSEAARDRSLIRVAVDLQHARPETPVKGASEIAVFPPVTGG